MEKQVLEEFGLTSNESLVYLDLLKLGSSSATEVIQKTGLHRAVVYDVLERLIEKGLVSHVIQGRKKFFEATNPKKLVEILKEKERRVNEILPNLLELSSFSSKLDVKVYKGKEGIKAVFEDILIKKPKEWLSMGSGGETYKLVTAYLTHYHKKRIKLGIKARGLLLDNAKARGSMLAKMDKTQIKYLPKGFKTPSVINLYDGFVSMYQVTNNNIPFIILIENKELYKSFKEYFEWLWKISI